MDNGRMDDSEKNKNDKRPEEKATKSPESPKPKTDQIKKPPVSLTSPPAVVPPIAGPTQVKKILIPWEKTHPLPHPSKSKHDVSSHKGHKSTRQSTLGVHHSTTPGLRSEKSKSISQQRQSVKALPTKATGQSQQHVDLKSPTQAHSNANLKATSPPRHSTANTTSANHPQHAVTNAAIKAKGPPGETVHKSPVRPSITGNKPATSATRHSVKSLDHKVISPPRHSVKSIGKASGKEGVKNVNLKIHKGSIHHETPKSATAVGGKRPFHDDGSQVSSKKTKLEDNHKSTAQAKERKASDSKHPHFPHVETPSKETGQNIAIEDTTEQEKNRSWRYHQMMKGTDHRKAKPSKAPAKELKVIASPNDKENATDTIMHTSPQTSNTVLEHKPIQKTVAFKTSNPTEPQKKEEYVIPKSPTKHPQMLHISSSENLRRQQIHEHKTRVIELSQEKAGDMFGLYSILGDTNHSLFQTDKIDTDEDTRSLPSGDTSGPDRSWIVEWSGNSSDDDYEIDELLGSRNENYQPIYQTLSPSLQKALQPLFIVMFVCGRLPFRGGFGKYNLFRLPAFKMLSSFGVFCITSLFLLLVLCLLTVSTLSISYNDEAVSKAYLRLERLYLQKYWLQVSIFFVMLIFVVISNGIIIFNGNSISRWFALMVKETNRYNINFVNLTNQIRIVSIVHLTGLLTYFIYMAVMFSASSATPGVRGGTYAITVILFHYAGGIRVNLNWFPYLTILVLVLQMYVMICSHLCILLPMLCSLIVRNMALSRNYRIGVIVNNIATNNALGGEEELRDVLTYNNVFSLHNSANRLLREFCEKAFTAEICVYYLMKITIICFCLYKISTTSGFIFFEPEDLRVFNDTAVRDTKLNITIEDYRDSNAATIYDSIFYLGVSLVGFISVTEAFADCSLKFQKGAIQIRNIGLIFCKGSRERRFILSLSECFTSVHPYMVNPGLYFQINRRFIIHVIEWAAFIFMVLIQTQTNPLVSKPIYGVCESLNGTSHPCVIGYVKGARTVSAKVSETSKTVAKEQVENKPVIPIEQEIYLPVSFSKFAEYCPQSDVIRMIGFDSNFEKIPLPKDRFECISQPYKRGLTYYDAFGNEAPRDDCGMPKFPLKKSYYYSVASYPSVLTTELKDGQFNCWNFQPGGHVGSLAVKDLSQDYRCGFPADYASQLCKAWKTELSLEQTQSLVLAEEQENQADSAAWSSKCIDEDFETGQILNRVSELRLNPANKYFATPFFIYDLTTNQTTFIPFRKDGKPWPTFTNWKYQWAPYTSTSMRDKCKPAFYYDCKGKLLKEFDDSGFLPFSYQTNDGPQEETLTISKLDRKIKCFKTRWLNQDLLCGLRPSSKSTLDDLILQRMFEWNSILESPSPNRNRLIGYN